MENKDEIMMKYQLFGSGRRGDAQVEMELASLMTSMTTPDNVRKLEEAVEGPLRMSVEKLRALKDAFRKIDAKKKDL